MSRRMPTSATNGADGWWLLTDRAWRPLTPPAVYHILVVHSFAVKRRDVISRIGSLLDEQDDRTVGTSMRIPESLRDAAALAVEHLHVAQSTTALTADALRSRLEAIVLQAALDSHYRENPRARPSLGDLAVAAAELGSHPLASRPDVLRRAAEEVVQTHPDADADDVLLWAEAQASVAG